MLADEVAVDRAGEVVHGGGPPEVGVDDEAQGLELLEHPVDGRGADLGRAALDPRVTSSAVRSRRASTRAWATARLAVVTRLPAARSAATISSSRSDARATARDYAAARRRFRP